MNSRVFPEGMAFEMLEPCAAKGACAVLRGLGVGNNPRLPDSSVSSDFAQPQNVVVLKFSRFEGHG
jgi:hypothetical protein